MRVSAPEFAARNPHRAPVPVRSRGRRSPRDRQPAELARLDYDGGFEQTAPLDVLDQRHARRVGGSAVAHRPFGALGVLAVRASGPALHGDCTKRVVRYRPPGQEAPPGRGRPPGEPVRRLDASHPGTEAPTGRTAAPEIAPWRSGGGGVTLAGSTGAIRCSPPDRTHERSRCGPRSSRFCSRWRRSWRSRIGGCRSSSSRRPARCWRWGCPAGPSCRATPTCS